MAYTSRHYEVALEGQTKTATPSTTSQTITPDSGKKLTSVTVEAMPTGSATTPATTKAQSTPNIFVNGSGLIMATVAATSVSVTPTVTAGYVSAGTAGTITMSASSSTIQLTTQAAKTITPSTTAQTAVASRVFTTGDVTVAAINTQTKTATANGTINPDSGYYLSSVTVSIPVYDGTIS